MLMIWRVGSLAKDLYTTRTRFVYELIQNAEDNKYNAATITNEAPWLRFSLTHDKIVVDSNEVGFTKKDVSSICSSGESTKKHKPGYVGEKGIGFKSVFNVSHKVHIQSGPYSFAFYYRKSDNDNGIGMVTPFNEPYEDLPGGTRTRLTLHLLEDQNRSHLARELLDLPDSLLLFTRTLKKLSVHVDLPNEIPQSRTYTSHSNEGLCRISEVVMPSNETINHRYWTTRRSITNMPESEARANISEAEVALAFPLDFHNVPIVKEQYAFAFLPIRKVGFKVRQYPPVSLRPSRSDIVIRSLLFTPISSPGPIVKMW